MRSDSPTVDAAKRRAFAVICAGESRWTASSAGIRPIGGAMTSALALVRQDVRTGLATVLPDDAVGRALRDQSAATGLDVRGVELASPSTSLRLLRGGARQAVSTHLESNAVAVPEEWSSSVLLLSGLSPVVTHAAALCKAARAAGRAGSAVVVDVNAPWQLWNSRDARSIRMLLREADAVWCSAEDLRGLGMDGTTVRGAMRDSAVLVLGHGAGAATARGPFGEVSLPQVAPTRRDGRDGDAFSAAICAELARHEHAARREHTAGRDLWVRALERGRAFLSLA
jgi:fructokinase/2-dehydro-3-deoxygluconokinase